MMYQWQKNLGTYREHLRQITQRDFGDTDGGFWHTVRHNGGTEQLSIADWRKMYVEDNAVVDG